MPNFDQKLTDPQIEGYYYSKYGSTFPSVVHCHSENTTAKDLAQLRHCIASMEHYLLAMRKSDDSGSCYFRDQMITISAVIAEIALDTQRIAEIKLGKKVPTASLEEVDSKVGNNNSKDESSPQQQVPAVRRYEYYKHGTITAKIYHNHPTKNQTIKDLPKIEGCLAYMQTFKNNFSLYRDSDSTQYHDGLITIRAIEAAIAEDFKAKDQLEEQLLLEEAKSQPVMSDVTKSNAVGANTAKFFKKSDTSSVNVNTEFKVDNEGKVIVSITPY